jgi:hypothetical protein
MQSGSSVADWAIYAIYARPHRHWLSHLVDLASGDVVQLVRTLPCHGRGRGFESRRPRHSFEWFTKTPKNNLGPFGSNKLFGPVGHSIAVLPLSGTSSEAFERFVASPLLPRRLRAMGCAVWSILHAKQSFLAALQVAACDGTHGLIVFYFSSFRQSFQQLSGRRRANLPRWTMGAICGASSAWTPAGRTTRV